MKDLSVEGFPLAGGRVDYVGGRAVSTLVYHRRRHVINVFIWPSENASGRIVSSKRQGYNIEHWSANGMTYWAISDLNARELGELSALLRQ